MRMIERWFPCMEVSQAAAGGWGSGKSEKALFIWFAARPLAQAKAAVITSLLPWPDDPAEQHRLQELVRGAMSARDGMHAELLAELRKCYPDGAVLLDPFSGRGMIPLEAARLSVKAWGFDYSPVATLAGSLLADFPLRDFSKEPSLPFGTRGQQATAEASSRLLEDVGAILAEVGRRYEAEMAMFYPRLRGQYPWGYLWAVTLPCQDCKRHFPMTGSLMLRYPLAKKHDPGQSYRIEVDRRTGTFRAVVQDGVPSGLPTLVAQKRNGKDVKGKVAICPFCDHNHSKDLHTRLAMEGLGRDELLLAADVDEKVGKRFRELTEAERIAVRLAEDALTKEPQFGPGLPATPNEVIPPGNGDTVRPSMYGARTYGDICNARQNLGFVRLSRIIAKLGEELRGYGVSSDYAGALCGYAGSVLVRRLRRSTRAVTIQPHIEANSNRVQTTDMFRNETSIGYSYDYFETGMSDGPGTWHSIATDTIAVLRNQASRLPGRFALIRRGSARSLPLKPASMDAVVTDPPYDNMIDYSDASDLFYVWLKRALSTTHPNFGVTADPRGLQEKTEEIIVKRGGSAVNDHRTEVHYDKLIAEAFAQACGKVRPEGVVTIVFGHGDPDVWRRFLKAITKANLVLTGSWPAKTETGGTAEAANIVTTLTMCCRPAPAERPTGRLGHVQAEVRGEVRNRMSLWESAGLALTDQLMASAGPAMEVVGRYSEILDITGKPVDITGNPKLPDAPDFILLARRTVREVAAIQIDNQPLESFDSRTSFALFWVRQFGRGLAPKSEARWQAMAAELSSQQRLGILMDQSGGTRLARSEEVNQEIRPTSAIIDVAFALARAWPDGLSAVAEVFAKADRSTDDPLLWAALTYLSAQLPEADSDRRAWTQLVRMKAAISSRARSAQAGKKKVEEDQDKESRQMKLISDGDIEVSASARKQPENRSSKKQKQSKSYPADTNQQADLFRGNNNEGT